MKTKDQSGVVMSIAGVVAALGCCLIVRGVALAWRPGGWILAGVMVAIPSIFVAYDEFRRSH